MTEIDKLGNINHSCGDVFRLNIKLNRELDGDEKLYFSIKRNNNVELSVEAVKQDNGIYSVVIDSSEMAKLEPHKYTYDLVAKLESGNNYTPFKSKTLNILEVSHNV